MKSKLLFILSLTFLLSIFYVFYSDKQVTNASTSGAPAGHTGVSLAISGEASCTNCHTGTQINGDSALSITHNIPVAGYVAGQTYSITLILNKSGIVKSGFQIGCFQGTTNTQAGSFVSNTDVQTLSSGKYATHKSTSTSGTNGRNWTFDWIAPITGTGNVTFSFSANASNNNNTTSGDQIYHNLISVTEDASISTQNIQLEKNIHVYPNPIKMGEPLQIYTSNNESASIEIFDVKGTNVFSQKLALQIGINVVNYSNISNGIYLIKVTTPTKQFQRQWVFYN